jgi:hypothetical protein
MNREVKHLRVDLLEIEASTLTGIDSVDGCNRMPPMIGAIHGF